MTGVLKTIRGNPSLLLILLMLCLMTRSSFAQQQLTTTNTSSQGRLYISITKSPIAGTEHSIRAVDIATGTVTAEYPTETRVMNLSQETGGTDLYYLTEDKKIYWIDTQTRQQEFLTQLTQVTGEAIDFEAIYNYIYVATADKVYWLPKDLSVPEAVYIEKVGVIKAIFTGVKPDNTGEELTFLDNKCVAYKKRDNNAITSWVNATNLLGECSEITDILHRNNDLYVVGVNTSEIVRIPTYGTRTLTSIADIAKIGYVSAAAEGLYTFTRSDNYVYRVDDNSGNQVSQVYLVDDVNPVVINDVEYSQTQEGATEPVTGGSCQSDTIHAGDPCPGNDACTKIVSECDEKSGNYICVSYPDTNDRDGDKIPDCQDQCPDDAGSSTFNSCGICGAPPQETCDGVDNDCDGQIDEDVTKNACGQCGATPAETCDGADNDCDGQTDEGLLNACGTCGAIPDETCDGADNDCDGQTDEGLLNACGQCGATPAETCDGVDNDCDEQIDEDLLNACGTCGTVPDETCDGLDNDCDDAVDEGFDSDNDGTPDCFDGCEDDAAKTDAGVCGCGVADTDTDSDGIMDCEDNCPDVSNPDQLDADKSNVGDACEETEEEEDEVVYCQDGVTEIKTVLCTQLTDQVVCHSEDSEELVRFDAEDIVGLSRDPDGNLYHTNSEGKKLYRTDQITLETEEYADYSDLFQEGGLTQGTVDSDGDTYLAARDLGVIAHFILGFTTPSWIHVVNQPDNIVLDSSENTYFTANDDSGKPAVYKVDTEGTLSTLITSAAIIEANGGEEIVVADMMKADSQSNKLAGTQGEIFKIYLADKSTITKLYGANLEIGSVSGIAGQNDYFYISVAASGIIYKYLGTGENIATSEEVFVQGLTSPTEQNFTRFCPGRKITECVPSAEICDGVDNDCDDQVDEDLDADGDGVSSCDDDCDDEDALAYPEASEVCDGVDNNCDDVVDETCECDPIEERQCGETDEGECEFGTQTCSDEGIWSSECEGEQEAVAESCDDEDNDCDGEVDEGCLAIELIGNEAAVGSEAGVDDQDTSESDDQAIVYTVGWLSGGSCRGQLAVNVHPHSIRFFENQILFLSLVSLFTLLSLRFIKSRSRQRQRAYDRTRTKISHPQR